VKTTTVDTAERGRSLLGAHIRFLMDGPHGNMIHSTVPSGMVGRACHFRRIDEYWYVLSGEGEVWRQGAEPCQFRFKPNWRVASALLKCDSAALTSVAGAFGSKTRKILNEVLLVGRVLHAQLLQGHLATMPVLGVGGPAAEDPFTSVGLPHVELA